MNLLPLLLPVLTLSAAAHDGWWAIRPVAKREPPRSDNSWVRSPIDAFILAKLNEQGLKPSAEADRRTLIRRLTFNLHGLPPTPDEIDAFVHDSRSDAYERLVDRLLSSPRYGERWARHWLDTVHYGESHGYDKDKPRPNAWPYRDYVIRSFNSDKPYSRFVEEQLAGDVLYPDDPDGIVATGFIAAGPWDFVGHVELPESKMDGLIARYNDRDDMLMTAMSTFQSVTVHCARCHDHKFDPISQEDYYRLQAVFAGVDRADRPYDRDPSMHRRRIALAAEKRRLEAQRTQLNEQIAKATSPHLSELDQRLESQLSKLAKLPTAGANSPSNGYHSSIMPTPDHTKWVQLDLGRSVPIDAVKLFPARPTDFPDTPGFGFPQRYRIELSDDESFAASRFVFDRSKEDESNPGDQPITIRTAGVSARFVRVTATKLWKRTNDYVFALAELEVHSGGQNAASGAAVSALDSIEAGRWSTRYLVDRFSSRAKLDGADAGPAMRMKLEAEIESLRSERAQKLDRLLDEGTRDRLRRLNSELDHVERQLRELPPQQMVFAASNDFKPQGGFHPAETPRVIHLLRRGDVKQAGPVMPPGALECLNHQPFEFIPSDAPSSAAASRPESERRAALAKWITHPDNPLTRRSIVNRVWQYHFGRGIVETPNDFGLMGAEPTHAELLDWLATWFFENGESVKSLHRLILTSSVYRQQSTGVSALDADNRYLWRMNRTRLDAESIRDSVLAASGKLDDTMGGPSVQQFYFKDDHSPVYDYTQFDVDSPGSFRRSIYRFIVRSVPDPFMDSFDCPDANLLVPKRNTTLTALQALSLLNNAFMVRQAEHFATRLRAMASDPAAQIDAAYQLALGRSPTRDESHALGTYAAEHGLENVCRLLFNSNEFMFVD